MAINGVVTTNSYSAGVFSTGVADLKFGGKAGSYMDGRLASIVATYNPPGGFATTSAATIAAALYNSGKGLRPSEITAAQRTAWGVVSGWLDNGSLTADAIGSNTLTNNNTVTLALTSGPWGKARTIATARTPYISPNFVSASIDSTGLLLSVVWDRAVTPNTPVPTLTISGATPTCAYSSGTGTTTLVYSITSGNPSGNPVLSGATVTLGVPVEAVTAVGGVKNAVVSGRNVTNSSTVLVPAGISGLQLWLCADGTLWQNSNLTTPAVADGDPVGAWVSQDAAVNNVTQATAGQRPTLKLNIQNSKPGILFTRASSQYLSNLMGDWYGGGFTNFIVFKNQTTNVSQSVVGGLVSSNLACAVNSEGTDHIGYFKMAVGGWLNAGSAVNGTTCIMSYYGPNPVGGTPTMSAAKNNSAAVTGSALSGITAATGLSIGGYSGGDNNNAYIMEAISYNSVLNSTAISAVLSYLNSKWAVY
jgi:hypothetical protein